MSLKRILALSSSRSANSGYLETAQPLIGDFLKKNSQIAFIPFAAVDENYEGYVSAVKNGLAGLQHTINLAGPANAQSVIEGADVIMVGGGNTFKLLHDLYKYNLLDLIRRKINSGTPYIGWSAGSNITAPTISTTNDMPVIEPESFKSLGFFPFQLNPHYINVKVEGQNSETRDQRLTEFLMLHPGTPIVALPEGTALKQEEDTLAFIGEPPGFLFELAEKDGEISKRQIEAGMDLSFLL